MLGGRCLGPRPGLDGEFFTSQKNNPRPVQNSVLKIDWTRAYFEPGQMLAQNNPRLGRDRGCVGIFSPLGK